VVSDVVLNPTGWCLSHQSPDHVEGCFLLRASIDDIAVDDKDIVVVSPVDFVVVIDSDDRGVLIGITNSQQRTSGIF